MSRDETKTCPVCGRAFAWRAKWARSWSQVIYCGERCRRRKGSDLDRRIEEWVLSRLEALGPGKSMCPSEAARALAPDDWRRHMDAVRSAGRRLEQRGQLCVTQGGRVVDAATARGPIRYRMPR